MTVQQLCERIQRSYPEIGFYEIMLDLTQAERSFAEDTEIVQDVVFLLRTADYSTWGTWDYEEAEDGLILTAEASLPALFQNQRLWMTTNPTGQMALPASIKGVKRAIQLDEHQSQLVPGHQLNVSARELRLPKHPNSWPTNLYAIGMDCVLVPAPLTAMTDEPTVPAEYHLALEAKVQGLYALRTGAAPLAQGWFAQAKTLEIAAKKAANSGGNRFLETVRPDPIMRP